VEAKERVRIKDSYVKFSKWIEKYEKQRKITNIKDTLQELRIESSSKLRSIKFRLHDVSKLSSRFTENITLVLFSKLIADNYNYLIKHINAVCG
jgi:hypothetical protein